MKELKAIIKQICAEKGISEEDVYATINSALAAAYRKDFGEKNQNIVAEYDFENGTTAVYDQKTVVEDLTEEQIAAIDALRLDRETRRAQIEQGEKVPEKTEAEKEAEELIRKFNPKSEIELKDAKLVKKSFKVDDIVRTPLEIPGDFGRMAAQTAKQVIIQRLREAERNVVYQQYKEKEGELLNAVVQKREGRNVLVDLDQVTAILPSQEQIRFERYNVGDRFKVILLAVTLTTRGPELIVSRANTLFIEKLFANEIPEIANEVISIKGIAREAGSRSKVAVWTDDENIDPIGSCIGQRGSRIQTIINELGGEKIDIIEHSDDPIKLIGNSLLPAKITSVELNEETQIATVTVPEDQLSLTIGRDGQNVRLAVKLTGWKINIKEQESGKEITKEDPADSNESSTKEDKDATEKTEKETPVEDVSTEDSAKEDVSAETEAKEEKPKKKAAKKTKKDEKEEASDEEKKESSEKEDVSAKAEAREEKTKKKAVKKTKKVKEEKSAEEEKEEKKPKAVKKKATKKKADKKDKEDSEEKDPSAEAEAKEEESSKE